MHTRNTKHRRHLVEKALWELLLDRESHLVGESVRMSELTAEGNECGKNKHMKKVLKSLLLSHKIISKHWKLTAELSKLDLHFLRD